MDENIEPVEETTGKRSKIKIVVASLATAVVIYGVSYAAAKAVGKKIPVPNHQG